MANDDQLDIRTLTDGRLNYGEACPDCHRAAEQCAAMCPIPYFYKGQMSHPACVLTKGHEGCHRASIAYESREWRA